MKINVYLSSSDSFHKILHAFAEGAERYDTVNIISTQDYSVSDLPGCLSGQYYHFLMAMSATDGHKSVPGHRSGQPIRSIYLLHYPAGI